MAKNNKDPNQKHYFETLENQQVPEFLAEIKKFGGELQLWSEGKHQKAETFYVEDIDQSGNAPVLKLSKKSSGLFGKITGSSLINQSVLLKMALGKFSYFTQTFLDYDTKDALYEIAIRDKVFKSQQRSNFRLQASEYIKIELKFHQQSFLCHDISASGLSFIDPQNKLGLTKGSIIENAQVTLNQKAFEIAKILVVASFEGEDRDGNQFEGIKYGLAFNDLSEEVEEKLTIHINSEARGEEVQKQLKKNR